MKLSVRKSKVCLVLVVTVFMFSLNLRAQDQEILRCSATFARTEFGAGLTKHLQSDGTITLKNKYNQIVRDGGLRAEVLNWEARVIAWRAISGKDAILSFEGASILEDVDDIYMVDSSKRIFGFRNNGLYGVLIVSDSLVKRKIKDKQSLNSPIIIFLDDDKNLTSDESTLDVTRSKDTQGQEELGVRPTSFKRDRVGQIGAKYRSVSFYSKGKIKTLGKDNVYDMNIELIIMETLDGDKVVFDAYGNEVLSSDFNFDKVKVVNKSVLVASRAGKDYTVEIRENYVTLDDGERVTRVDFE